MKVIEVGVTYVEGRTMKMANETRKVISVASDSLG